MSSDVVLTVSSTVLGAVVGALISRYYFHKGASRSRLQICLTEITRLNPATVGVQVKMKVGTIDVTNIVLLEVAVTNKGPNDIVVDDPEDVELRATRPRIDLPEGLRALADPWNPTGSKPASDVRVARQLLNGRQTFHIHIHRLASGASCTARILCTQRGDDSAQELAGPAIGFAAGFLQGTDIKPAGLLASATAVA